MLQKVQSVDYKSISTKIWCNDCQH